MGWGNRSLRGNDDHDNDDGEHDDKKEMRAREGGRVSSRRSTGLSMAGFFPNNIPSLSPSPPHFALNTVTYKHVIHMLRSQTTDSAAARLFDMLVYITGRYYHYH